MAEPAAIVEDFVAAIVEGDVARAMTFLPPDFILYETTRLPYAGVYRGPAGFGQLLERIGAFWETFEPRPESQIVPDGNTVVLIGELRGKPRHCDEKLTIPVIERYLIEGDRIRCIWPFYIDTHLTDAQVG